jgi:hypothetical protein
VVIESDEEDLKPKSKKRVNVADSDEEGFVSEKVVVTPPVSKRERLNNKQTNKAEEKAANTQKR